MSATRQGSVRRRHSRTCASGAGGRCRCAGGWQLRARLASGERVEQGGFASKTEAETALGELLRDVRRGTFRRLEPVAFDGYARGWLEHVRPTIRPSTHASYSQIVRTHLEPYFGSMMVGAIAPAHVRAFVAAKAAATRPNGRPVWKPATVRNALVCLKMVLSAAVEDGHAAVNPAAKVSPPKVERQENETLTSAELDRVYAVAGEPWETIFRFLSWTGCRRGEALALRWSDVDLPAGRAFVRRSLGKFGEGAPKSAAGRRVVPLTPSLVAMLRRLHLAQPPDGAEDGGRVFRSRTGGALDPDHVGRAWRRALRKAGVRHVRMHTLRDVAVSRMVSAGASVKTVQTAVGHSSPLLTLRTYAHLLEDDVDRLAEELAKLDARLAERVPVGDPSGTTLEDFGDSESTSADGGPIALPMREVG